MADEEPASVKVVTQHVELPDWIGTEVTGQRSYYNSYLVQHPYCTWPKSQGQLA